MIRASVVVIEGEPYGKKRPKREGASFRTRPAPAYRQIRAGSVLNVRSWWRAADGGPDAASLVVGQLIVLVVAFVGFVETVESVAEPRLMGNTRVGRGGNCWHDGDEDTKDVVPSRGGVQTGRSLDERWKVGIAMQDISNKLGSCQPAGICMIGKVNEATGPGNGIEAGIIYTGR